MWRGRIIAPLAIGTGGLAVLVGIAAIVHGGPLLAAWGVIEALSGLAVVYGGRALWRYQERQRRNGWPE